MTFRHALFDYFECREDALLAGAEATQRLLEAAQTAQLSVVAHRCHQFPNGGYTTFVLLQESHLAVHTWPENRYCAVDIATCKGDPLDVEAILRCWFEPKWIESSVHHRGTGNRLVLDERWEAIAPSQGYFEAFACNERLVDQQSRFQRIQLVENPEFGKVLFLDGDIQMATSDERSYHAHLVHPAMLAHPEPENVLIMGGGDGGALRETLKHPSLRQVTLVDLDEQVVAMAKEYLGEVHSGAFDDQRVRVVFADALSVLGEQLFDVIISDLTAATAESEASLHLIPERAAACLTPDGIFATHTAWWPTREGAAPEPMPRHLHALLDNRWIPSFACHWGFMVGWAHNASPEAVTARIRNRASDAFAPFDAEEYAVRAFFRRARSIA